MIALFTGGIQLGKRRALPHARKSGWRPAMAVIKPESFFSARNEKTKMNWFCYEIALETYKRISDRLGERLVKSGITEDALTDFSVKLAKDTKVQILDWMEGRIEKVCFSDETVRTRFPSLDDDMIDEIFDAILEAWDGLLEICGSCPNACITNRNEIAPMFDGDGH